MNEDKILMSIWNTKDIIKTNITMRCGNVSTVHTYTICCMNLVSVGVVIMHGEIVEVPCDVVSGTEIHVPIVVDVG
jgi:hypothetical protein